MLSHPEQSLRPFNDALLAQRASYSESAERREVQEEEKTGVASGAHASRRADSVKHAEQFDQIAYD